MKEDNLANVAGEMVFYCSKTTHTRIEKAAILFGYGTKAIRWTATYAENKMDTAILIKSIKADERTGRNLF